MPTTDLVPPRRCNGTNRRGEPCRKPPIPGGTVCSAHGGSAPQVRAAAERRLARKAAEEHVAANLGDGRSVETIDDIYRMLLEGASLAVQMRDRLQQMVDTLRSWRYESAIGTEQVRTELRELGMWMDRTMKYGELIVRLDLDTRLARLNEAQGDLVFLAVSRALDAGDLTPAQRDAVEAALPTELRRAAGGGR